VTAPFHSILAIGAHLRDEELEARMIARIDAFLGRPARQRFDAGALLFDEDVELDNIWILIEGQVRLFRTIDGKEITFHAQTVGRIIGLLALSSGNRTFFACRAVTPITLLKISFADLNRALASDPDLLQLFSAVLMRSMARRNRRLVELQMEVLSLNKALAAERDQLSKTLAELQQAQALLIESEKMATLGQIAAGVAHELNNPISAIARSADFLSQDLQALAAALPNGEVFREQLEKALAQKPMSSREQREKRAQLAAELGDDTRAARMIEIGIERRSDFDRLARRLRQTPSDALDTLERYHQVGASLRNIDRCARRIAELVRSLRAYARADESEVVELDVHEGIEDTLLMLSHRLREVEVERQYAALPPIRMRAGELNQVWTNLIVNALDAMGNRGRLMIRTELHGPDRIAVHIIDNGPGIPPEHLPRIFDLRFTTRQGRVEFGLGLGLSICKNIVRRVGGAIDVESRPGFTDFRVTLPITFAEKAESQEPPP
jgi:C4-dicarboxylate-specific signal transduction histidine kinase